MGAADQMTCGRCRKHVELERIDGLIVKPDGWSHFALSGSPVIHRLLCPACAGVIRKIVSAVA